MDYLSRVDDLKEENDTYYEIIYDLIQTKMNQHFEQFYSAPRYLLAGENKVWEISRIIFQLLKGDNHYSHYAQVYEEIRRSADVKLYGMKIIFVANDLGMLEVA